MAEAKGSDEDKDLSCPICLETFESPKILTCLHTFCERCICKHVHSVREEGIQLDGITCPICKSPTISPFTDQTVDEWAANLPNNSMVLSSWIPNQSSKDDPIHCQTCLTDGKRNIAFAICVNCSEYLCKVCHDYHIKFKVSNNHTTTLLSMPENQILNENKDKLFRCSRHLKKYTYFCQEDKDVCCSKCAITDHRGCKDLILIENLSKSVTESTEIEKKVLGNLHSLRHMFLTLHENRLNNLESIKQSKSEITEAIKEWSTEVKELTGKLEAATLEKLEEAYRQDAVIISDQIVECKSAIAAIETSERILFQENKSNDGKKLFITTTRVNQQVMKYLKKYDTVDDECKDYTLEFQRDENFEGVAKTLSSLGQVLCKASKIPGLFPDIAYQRAMVLSPRAQKDSMQTWNAKLEDDVATCEIYSGIFLNDDHDRRTAVYVQRGHRDSGRYNWWTEN
ncbi:hypothetical protein CHS0354_009534 [Potamilus streckersoni]|uniref:RING-type domain-containing protein n=1 Tax=Potamilus streckersoni TaxID=2493646 RepID=A0AAE0SPK4_9BIVA|nr:hypothetical protein CHS0354_009534 [Potamilus streckersoni]